MYICSRFGFIHYENMPIQIYWKFYHQKKKKKKKKNENLQLKA